MATIDPQFEANLERYAHLIIEAGCNLQPGQELFLNVPVQTTHFTQLLTRVAYECGAGHVTIEYYDEKISRMHYDYCGLEVFETVPEWSALLNNSMARKGAAVLSILSDDPEAMTGIDPAKAVAKTRAMRSACKEFYDAIDFGHNAWCIAGAASKAWAQKVFPEDSEDNAIQKLWDAIFTTARVYTDDPLTAWKNHRESFAARIKRLDTQHFDSLHYTNASGTDFTVGLPEKHIWKGGGDTT
ncbi:MAG: aminopeptidase, partial [Raoultibacter sp.]